MKKIVQIAFAITLIVLSLISTFVSTELINSIVLGIVVPSLLFSIITFIDSIAVKCKENATEFSSVLSKLAGTQLRLSGQLLEETQSEENAQRISELLKTSSSHTRESVDYARIANAMNKCQSLLKYIRLIVYVLLFLSMILSPYIALALSKINLNCITLWSLTILYIDSELKYEITAKSFDLLVKHFVKKHSQKGK